MTIEELQKAINELKAKQHGQKFFDDRGVCRDCDGMASTLVAWWKKHPTKS